MRDCPDCKRDAIKGVMGVRGYTDPCEVDCSESIMNVHEKEDHSRLNDAVLVIGMQIHK